jgi:hypothetical protein
VEGDQAHPVAAGGVLGRLAEEGTVLDVMSDDGKAGVISFLGHLDCGIVKKWECSYDFKCMHS